jgi:hypothetical protein
MKKIISFSLYGGHSKYTVGAICNAEIAKKIFPEWICRFYCGTSVPEMVIERLKSYDNCEVILMEEDNKYPNMMWRFLALDDDDVEVMLSRDADSRLSNREKFVVDIFLNSDKLFHSIRDSPHHSNIMGGMWGLKKNDRVNKIGELLEKWKMSVENNWQGNSYHYDESFLRNNLGSIFSDSIMIHCSHYLNNFPVEFDEHKHFVGMWFYEDNEGKPYDYVHY